MRYEMMDFKNIRSPRIDNGYTQKQPADLLNVHQTSFSDYELGKVNIPVSSLHIPADFCNVSIDYLLCRTNAKKPYPKQ